MLYTHIFPIFYFIYFVSANSQQLSYELLARNNSHYCTVHVPARETVTSSCSTMLDYFLKGFSLDYEAMKLDKGDPQQLEKYVAALLKMATVDQIEVVETRKQSKDCVFYRLATRQERLCCNGWTGVHCDLPICYADCSGSKCIGPNQCNCSAGYSGKYCQERQQIVTPTKAYCYEKKSCFGSLLGLEDYDWLTGEAECCQSDIYEGQSWGSSDGDCTPCKRAVRNLTSPYIPENIGVPRAPRTCDLWGGTYVETFGGQIFTTDLTCDIDLILSADTNVTLMMEGCTSCTVCTKKLLVSLSKPVGVAFVLSGDTISFEGRPTRISSTIGYSSAIYGIDISKKGDSYNMTAANLNIIWEERNNIRIKLNEVKAALAGLCGPLVDNSELVLRTGELTKSVDLYVESWFTERSKDAGCDAAPRGQDGCHSNDVLSAKNRCSQLLEEPFTSCHDAVDYSVYMEDCVNKLCSCIGKLYVSGGRALASAPMASEEDGEAVVCQTLEAYAIECRKRGVQFPWRTDDRCPVSCQHGMIYSNCAPPCPSTCSNILASALKPQDQCKKQNCTPGCHCPAGTFLDHEEKCVPAARCSCWMRGQRYPPLASVTINCNKCQCKNGDWVCGKEACPKTCFISNERRVTTFDGVRYEFNPLGEGCRYTLVEMVGGEKLVGNAVDLVAIDNGFESCSIDSHQNCTRSIRISFRVQDSGSTIDIELKSDYSISINDKVIRLKPYSSPHIEYDVIRIWSTSEQLINLDTPDLRINFAGEGWNSVVLGPRYQKMVRGLCGNMDGSVEREFVSRQNIEEHVTNFVQSYSTCSLDPATPSTYDPCEHIPASKLTTIRDNCNSLFNSTLFDSCLALIDRRHFLEGCVTDHCVQPDSVFYPCNLLSIYATMCAERGALVEWSKVASFSGSACTELTGFVCAAGSYYTDCLSTDRPLSCFCLSAAAEYGRYRGFGLEGGCIAGCRCLQTGHVFDEEGKCVEESKCPCVHPTTGKLERAGAEFSKLCKTCKCTSGGWQCAIQPNCSLTTQCPANQIYSTKHPVCQRQCSNYDVPCTHLEVGKAFEGCACPEGLVASPNRTCVKPSDCPCQYNDRSYGGGEKIVIGCSIYTCSNRRWSVKQMSQCRRSCTTYGGQHYRSFDGRTYTVDVRLDCEVVLLRMKRLDVVARNIPCGDVALVCSKAIFIGYGRYKLRLLQDTAPIINGESSELGGIVNFGGGVIRSTDLFIVVSLDNGLDLLWDYGTRIQISVSQDLREEAMEGLCDLSAAGASDPSSIVDKSACSNYVICNGTTEVKYTSFCNGDDERAAWAKSSCDVIKTGLVFEACRQSLQTTEEYYQNCMTDACTCRLGENCQCLCTAIAAFAMECNRVGLYPEWRSNHFCPVMCSDDKVYHVCRTPCHPTCQNLYDLPDAKCHQLDCVEGCYCPVGTVENEKGQCVNESECRCLMDKRFYQPASIVEKDCLICACERGRFECVEKESCVRGCTRDEFECTSDSRCVDQQLRCDGIFDCADKSDEIGCGVNKTCDFGEFLCDSDRCVSNGARCDKVQDCVDAKDETNCDADCASDGFMCNNGRCVSSRLVCDSRYDCGIDDNSDESNCTSAPSCASSKAGGFSCRSKEACYPNHVTCDGVDDCGDGSDEIQCDKFDEKLGSEICRQGSSMVMLDDFHNGFRLSYKDRATANSGNGPSTDTTSSTVDWETPYAWKSRLNANNSRLYIWNSESEFFDLSRISFSIVGKGDVTIGLVRGGRSVEKKMFEAEKYILWESSGTLWNVSDIIIEAKSDWPIELKELIVIGCVSNNFSTVPTLDKCASEMTINYVNRGDVVILLTKAGTLVANNPVDILKDSPSIDASIIPNIEIGAMYTLKIRLLPYCPTKMSIHSVHFKILNLHQALLSVEEKAIWAKGSAEEDTISLTPRVRGDYLTFRFMSYTRYTRIYDLQIQYCCTTGADRYDWPTILPASETFECVSTSRIDANRQIMFDLAQTDNSGIKIKATDEILNSRRTPMRCLNNLDRVNIYVDILQPCPNVWTVGVVSVRVGGAKQLLVYSKDVKIFSMEIPASDREFKFSTSLLIRANNFTLSFLSSDPLHPSLSLRELSVDVSCRCGDSQSEENVTIATSRPESGRITGVTRGLATAMTSAAPESKEPEFALSTTQVDILGLGHADDATTRVETVMDRTDVSTGKRIVTDRTGVTTDGGIVTDRTDVTTGKIRILTDITTERGIGTGRTRAPDQTDITDLGGGSKARTTAAGTVFTSIKPLLGMTHHFDQDAYEDVTSAGDRFTVLPTSKKPRRRRPPTNRSCRRRDFLIVDYETNPNFFSTTLVDSTDVTIASTDVMLSGSAMRYTVDFNTSRRHKICLSLNKKCAHQWWLKQLQFKINCFCMFNISVADGNKTKVVMNVTTSMKNRITTVIWPTVGGSSATDFGTDVVELDIVRFDDRTPEIISDFEARFCCDVNRTSDTGTPSENESSAGEMTTMSDYIDVEDYLEDEITVPAVGGCAESSKPLIDILRELGSNCVPENKTVVVPSCEGSCGVAKGVFDHDHATFTLQNNAPCSCCQGDIKREVRYNLTCQTNGSPKCYTGIFQSQTECQCRRCFEFDSTTDQRSPIRSRGYAGIFPKTGDSLNDSYIESENNDTWSHEDSTIWPDIYENVTESIWPTSEIDATTNTKTPITLDAESSNDSTSAVPVNPKHGPVTFGAVVSTSLSPSNSTPETTTVPLDRNSSVETNDTTVQPLFIGTTDISVGNKSETVNIGSDVNDTNAPPIPTLGPIYAFNDTKADGTTEFLAPDGTPTPVPAIGPTSVHPNTSANDSSNTASNANNTTTTAGPTSVTNNGVSADSSATPTIGISSSSSSIASGNVTTSVVTGEDGLIDATTRDPVVTVTTKKMVDGQTEGLKDGGNNTVATMTATTPTVDNRNTAR